jgi:hypothetical protein
MGWLGGGGVAGASVGVGRGVAVGRAVGSATVGDGDGVCSLTVVLHPSRLKEVRRDQAQTRMRRVPAGTQKLY